MGIFESNCQVQQVSYVMSQLYRSVTCASHVCCMIVPTDTHLKRRGHIATRTDLGFVPSAIDQIGCVWSAASLQARTSNPEMGSETACSATLGYACSHTLMPPLVGTAFNQFHGSYFTYFRSTSRSLSAAGHSLLYLIIDNDGLNELL